MIVKKIIYLYMNIIIVVKKNVQEIQKYMKKKNYAQMNAMKANLNIIIFAIMIAQLILLGYSKIEISVLIKFQKIFIQIIEIIFIKNVIILVKYVVYQEMKKIIIVMNVQIIIYLLMILLYLYKIVMLNVTIITIWMEIMNIFVLLIHLVLMIIPN